ncbi:MAG: GvpL/GvpF family gas vesicle protein [Chloroflexota bacterium]|nr:GvpL/GvpF family gas vesicle protein [Chloroflexota bacterium]
MDPNSSIITDVAYYIFGLVYDSPLPKLSGFYAVPVQVVASVGKINAIGCIVPLEEFGQEEVANRINDMDWVSRIATLHYALSDQIYQHSQGFLPFRLCTIFSSPERVLELLETKQPLFEAEFERLSDKAEFGLKIWAHDAWLARRTIATKPGLREKQAAVTQGGGKAFFARKQFEVELAESKKQLVPQLTNRLTASVSAALSLPTGHSRNLTLPPNQAPDFVGLANLSLLLKRDQLEELKNVAERLDREALEGGLVEVLGPLPPYSFINLGEEEAN